MLARLRRHWGYSLSGFLHAAVLTGLAANVAPAPAAPPPIVELLLEAPALAEAVPLPNPIDVVTPSPPPPPPLPEAVELVEPPPVIESRAEIAPVVAPPPRKPVPKLVQPKPAEPVPPVAHAPLAPAEVKPVEMAAVIAPPGPAPMPVAPQAQHVALSGLSGPPPEYQMLLAERLRRFRIYPAAAQRRGQQGHAHLRFRVGRDGTVVCWRLDKSSGHPILDAEAEALVQRASPMPPPPADLADSALEFVVPIQFDLSRR